MVAYRVYASHLFWMRVNADHIHSLGQPNAMDEMGDSYRETCTDEHDVVTLTKCIYDLVDLVVHMALVTLIKPESVGAHDLSTERTRWEVFHLLSLLEGFDLWHDLFYRD